MSAFSLHPRLAADTWPLGRLTHSHLLLHRNAAVRWFILVPETAVLDFLDLPEPLRGALIDECVRVAAYIREESRFTRINFAAIGNLVPQLHLHVVGRHPGDPCWPQPVWGHLATDHSYSAAEVATIRDCLIQRIGLTPSH